MKKYYPSGDLNDDNNVYGYTVAQTLVQVLKQCGDNLTRENVMKQAASLDMTLPMLLPGVNVKTGPDDFFPIEREQLAASTARPGCCSARSTAADRIRTASAQTASLGLPLSCGPADRGYRGFTPSIDRVESGALSCAPSQPTETGP